MAMKKCRNKAEPSKLRRFRILQRKKMLKKDLQEQWKINIMMADGIKEDISIFENIYALLLT